MGPGRLTPWFRLSWWEEVRAGTSTCPPPSSAVTGRHRGVSGSAGARWNQDVNAQLSYCDGVGWFPQVLRRIRHSLVLGCVWALREMPRPPGAPKRRVVGVGSAGREKKIGWGLNCVGWGGNPSVGDRVCRLGTQLTKKQQIRTQKNQGEIVKIVLFL